MFRGLIDTLKSRAFWEGFLDGLSGPGMFGKAFDPLPTVQEMMAECRLSRPLAKKRVEESPQEVIAQAFALVGEAMWYAIDRFEELQPIAPAQAQTAARR